MEFEWNRLPYWKNKLWAAQLADESDLVQEIGSKHRRETSDDTNSGQAFKWPPGFGPGYDNGNVDDEEPEPLLTERDSKRVKIKKEASDDTTLAGSVASGKFSDSVCEQRANKPRIRGPFSSSLVGLATPSQRLHRSSPKVSRKSGPESLHIEQVIIPLYN